MSDKTEHGDWWCPRCREYLSPTRVTNQEVCDTCGAACYWHSGNELDEIERLTTELATVKRERDAWKQTALSGENGAFADEYAWDIYERNLDEMKGGGE